MAVTKSTLAPQEAPPVAVWLAVENGTDTWVLDGGARVTVKVRVVVPASPSATAGASEIGRASAVSSSAFATATSAGSRPT